MRRKRREGSPEAIPIGGGAGDRGRRAALPLLRAAVLLLLLAAAGCAAPQPRFAPEEGRPPAVRYAVVLEAEALDEALRARLLEASSLASARERPPANRLALRRRAREDAERLRAALRAEGFYAGEVELRIEELPAPKTPLPGAAAPEVRVVYWVDAGPRYRFGARRIRIQGEAAGFAPPSPEELGLVAGAPARAESVLEAERRLLARARELGHALARLGERRLVVDHQTRRMEVELVLDPGPVYRFGELRLVGGEGVDEGFLRRRVAIAPGSRFDPRRLEEARRRLLATGLFSRVQLEAAAPDEAGRLDVVVRVRPRKFRSLGGAIGYRADEGPRLRLFFEHRNLLGAGERLRASAQASPLAQEARLRFVKPDVLRRDQQLRAELRARRLAAAAYDSRSLAQTIALERRWGEGMRGSVEVRLRYLEERERGRAQRFTLLALGGTLALDRRDDPLDPETGWSLEAELVPTLALGGGRFGYLRARATLTRQWRLFDDPALVLAVRGTMGTVAGAARRALPADERLYAGGGGSIRGIPYATAGPLDANGDPLGGRSLVEASLELRWRIRERWQLAAFLDAGTAYPDPIPTAAEPLRVGSGVGLRYLTPVGPVRIDVAVPIDPRPGVDDPFQIYLSLGQPF